jgi:hypothetical protein
MVFGLFKMLGYTVWQASDQASTLVAYAGVCTLIGARAARMFEIVRRAAGESAEIAELWATLCRNRRAGSAMVVGKILESGPLRAGVSRVQAIDSLWVLNDPALYGALVLDSGWPDDHHRPRCYPATPTAADGPPQSIPLRILVCKPSPRHGTHRIHVRKVCLNPMAGFCLPLAGRPELRDPQTEFALHEVGEETRHSRLFLLADRCALARGCP